MPVQTVLGKVDKSDLGNITPHEHLFIDLTNQFRAPDDFLFIDGENEKVSMKYLGLLRRAPHALKDNLLINDYAISRDEIMQFKYAGGNSIVDVTNIGLGRSPETLKRLAIDTGVHIVMGCGYYYAATHPADMDSRSVESIADEIVSDIEYGVGETGVKAGVIGEIAISDVLYPNEEKVLAATGMAQKRTGLGVHIHVFPWAYDEKGFPFGIRALDICEKNGADPSKVSINHVDVAAGINLEYCTEIAKRGAYVQFDNFGHEFYTDRPDRKFIPGTFEYDFNRVKAIKALCDAGYEKQILVATDICHKTLLCHYGGWGYGHILRNIVHMFKDFDIPESAVKLMLRCNPARFLDVG